MIDRKNDIKGLIQKNPFFSKCRHYGINISNVQW